MKNYSQLSGKSLVEELNDLIEKKTVAIVEYKDIFREVYFIEISDDKIMVYQKSDYCADKKEGIRQLFLSEMILWEVVKTGVDLEEWKKELKELDLMSINFKK